MKTSGKPASRGLTNTIINLYLHWASFFISNAHEVLSINRLISAVLKMFSLTNLITACTSHLTGLFIAAQLEQTLESKVVGGLFCFPSSNLKASSNKFCLDNSQNHPPLVIKILIDDPTWGIESLRWQQGLMMTVAVKDWMPPSPLTIALYRNWTYSLDVPWMFDLNINIQYVFTLCACMATWYLAFTTRSTYKSLGIMFANEIILALINL